MTICGQLPIACQLLKRLALPDRIVAGDVIQNLGFQDEEAAVDKGAILVGFLAEPRHAVIPRHHIEDTEPAGLVNRGDRRGGAGSPVEVYQVSDIDIGDTITICQAEGVLSDV
jgi:hypothetical protein